MLFGKKKGLYEADRVVYIKLTELAPTTEVSPAVCDSIADADLARSVARYGILQPLTVRRSGHGYELISGARRRRAAELAGLREAPCIVLDVGEEQSAAIVLVENLLRRNLHFIDEAQSLARLRELYGYSQEETARLIGRSQSAVANKLRLLRLPPELLNIARESGLTERHLRALLRLPSDRAVAVAMAKIIADDLNVAQSETLIENLLAAPKPEPEPAEISPTEESAEPPAPREPVIRTRDHRMFVNSIERGAAIMRRGGIRVALERLETETELTIIVKITKRAG